MEKDLETLRTEIIGESLEHLKELVTSLASKGENSLFVGERGCGKEWYCQMDCVNSLMLQALPDGQVLSHFSQRV
jgi:hypothetical protein